MCGWLAEMKLKALLVACAISFLATPLRAEAPWLVLPPTPSLPADNASGLAAVDGIKLWYAVFGARHTETVLLLHGGLANSDYWGLLVPELARTHRVVVIDSRGHGRSSRNATPIGRGNARQGSAMSSNCPRSKLRPIDSEFWTVLNELPETIPVGKAELDAIDRYFSDVLDLVFRSKPNEASIMPEQVRRGQRR